MGGIARETAYETAAAAGAAEQIVLEAAGAGVAAAAKATGSNIATGAVKVYNTHQWAMATLWNGQCKITSNVAAAVAAAAATRSGATPDAAELARASTYDTWALGCWDVSQGPAPRYTTVGRTAPNPAAPPPPEPTERELQTKSFLDGLESLNANEVTLTLTQAESTTLDGATPQGSGINRVGAQAQDSAGYSAVGHEVQFGDAGAEAPVPIDDAAAADVLSEDNRRVSMGLKMSRERDYHASANKLKSHYMLRGRARKPTGVSSSSTRATLTKLTLGEQTMDLLGNGSRPLGNYSRKQSSMMAPTLAAVQEDNELSNEFFTLVPRRWKGI